MYSLDFTSCIFTIADFEGNIIKQFDLPTIEIFFDDQYFTAKDTDTEFKLHISELSDVDSGAYATFQDLWDAINAQKLACVSSGGGSETTTTMGALINSALSATPNNTDYVATAESGGALKKISWTNVKAFLKTYFDTIYTTTSAVASQITTALSGYLTSATASATYQVILTASNFGTFLTGLTGKTTPIDADELAISDSASSNVGKKVSLTNFKTYLKTYFDTLYHNKAIKVTADGTNITGTLVETLTQSLEITANTFATGDIVRIENFNEFTGTAGTKQVRLYLNTSASLSGATLIATTAPATANTRSIGMDSLLVVKSSSSTKVRAVSGQSYTFTGITSNAVSSVNIDWTTTQYLICSIQLGNTGDSGFNSFLTAEKL